jgi:hypothetical protein
VEAKGDDVAKHVKKLLSLEDDNYHSEYVVYYAKNLAKDKKLTKAAEAIVDLHQYFGGMSSELMQVREQLRKSAKELFSKRDPVGFKYAQEHGV